MHKVQSLNWKANGRGKEQYSRQSAKCSSGWGNIGHTKASQIAQNFMKDIEVYYMIWNVIVVYCRIIVQYLRVSETKYNMQGI